MEPFFTFQVCFKTTWFSNNKLGISGRFCRGRHDLWGPMFGQPEKKIRHQWWLKTGLKILWNIKYGEHIHVIQTDEHVEQQIQGMYERIHPKTKIAPEKWWLADKPFLLKCFLFRGLILIFGGCIHPRFIIYRFFLLERHCSPKDSWQIASELLAEMKLLWPWEGTGGTDGQMEELDMVRCLFFLKIHPQFFI